MHDRTLLHLPGNAVLAWQMLALAIVISFDKNNKIQTSINVEEQQRP